MSTLHHHKRTHSLHSRTLRYAPRGASLVTMWCWSDCARSLITTHTPTPTPTLAVAHPGGHRWHLHALQLLRRGALSEEEVSAPQRGAGGCEGKCGLAPGRHAGTAAAPGARAAACLSLPPPCVPRFGQVEASMLESGRLFLYIEADPRFLHSEDPRLKYEITAVRPADRQWCSAPAAAPATLRCTAPYPTHTHTHLRRACARARHCLPVLVFFTARPCSCLHRPCRTRRTTLRSPRQRSATALRTS